VNTRIFCGPTLRGVEIERHLPSASIAGPIALGDVIAALDDGVERIAIVDGFFDQRQPVWHKEILFALHAGVQVLGAASMGALRAVELEHFGMRGIGKIFELYRDGWLERDDEVTVVHAAASEGYRALSDALVNMRFTFRKAARAAIISDEFAEHCAGLSEQLFYAERTYQTVLSVAARDATRSTEAERLRTWLSEKSNHVDQKRADALELVQVLAGPPLPGARRSFAFANTDAWAQFLALRRAGR